MYSWFLLINDSNIVFNKSCSLSKREYHYFSSVLFWIMHMTRYIPVQQSCALSKREYNYFSSVLFWIMHMSSYSIPVQQSVQGKHTGVSHVICMTMGIFFSISGHSILCSAMAVEKLGSWKSGCVENGPQSWYYL